MKIITENAAYVQKNDIAYLTHTELPIPATIFEKVYGEGIVIIDNRNRYEFVKFDKCYEIEFFKGLDWMIDYNQVKDLKDEEIMQMGQDICDKRNKLAEKYNAMSIEDRKKNASLSDECDLLEFKMHSLSDVFLFMSGKLKMPFPKELREKNVIKRFIKKFGKDQK